MQGQLLVKLLSKTPKNVFTTNAKITSTNSVISSTFFKSNANPFHQNSFSEYATLSRSHLWKICSPNGVSGRIQQSTSVLTRSFLSNALLKGRSKFPAGVYFRRNFHSLDSKNRGRRSVSGMHTSDGVVLGLIMTNVAVFILWKIASPEFMLKNFMISVDNFTAGRWHTLITSAFSHIEPWHLITNMIGLYFAGKSIGQAFGPAYLLKLYLTGALVGSIFYLVYHAFIIAPLSQGKQMFGIDPSKVPALGASGAVNAILLLYIFLNPKQIIYVNFFIPVPALLFGFILIGEDIWRSWQGEKRTSGSAHLGGATVAAIAWLRIRSGRGPF